MSTAGPGDTVRVHYKGTLDDGSVFDASEGREPLEFTVGAGQVIEGFDQMVTGMEVGEKRTETLEPAQAYGEHDDGRMIKVPRDALPEGMEPQVGQPLEVQTEDGNAAPVVVAELAEDSITLDANHPLAGKPLTFEIELVEIA